jgi:hypothetical protein
MIDKNLGYAERVIRLLLGLAVAYWAFTQSQFGLLEWVAAVASFFLLLNAFFSRCYLWNLLGFDTCKSLNKDCPDGKDCNNADLI